MYGCIIIAQDNLSYLFMQRFVLHPFVQYATISQHNKPAHCPYTINRHELVKDVCVCSEVDCINANRQNIISYVLSF